MSELLLWIVVVVAIFYFARRLSKAGEVIDETRDQLRIVEYTTKDRLEGRE